MSCLFCSIARKEIPSHIVYEDDETLAFLDIHPVNPGHTLVIPKKHAADVFEADTETWVAIMKTVQKVAHGLNAALSPDGINIHVNNRSAAGQVIFHSHIHVIPRSHNDGHEHWKGKSYTPEEATAMQAAIAQALR